MDYSFKVVIFTLCLHLAWCSSDTYKAAFVNEDVKIENYARLVYEASKMNADILILPSPEAPHFENLLEICSTDTNDQIVKSISDASKSGKLYVVAHILDSMRCRGHQEIIKNNLVFDRDGSIIAVYRKPLHGSAKCNITNTAATTFTTDFGVTFGLLMEEDLVLRNAKQMKSAKNFVVTGRSSTNIPFLSANEFSSSWSYATNDNLISSKGIFAGRAGLQNGSGKVVVAQLVKDGGEAHPTITFNSPNLSSFPGEDLSQYTIKPLDIEASVSGHQETVCHDAFCCEFHLKTTFLGNPKEVNYGLVAYSGVLQYDNQHRIGLQSCALLACAGLYKRSCFLSSENTTNIMFDELTISANFTKNTAQFPIVHSISPITIEATDFDLYENIKNNNRQVTSELYNVKDILRFGFIIRDYRKDSVIIYESKSKASTDYTDYISSENFEEFFDYLWIRLRVVIFVVSIYILEML